MLLDELFLCRGTYGNKLCCFLKTDISLAGSREEAFLLSFPRSTEAQVCFVLFCFLSRAQLWPLESPLGSEKCPVCPGEVGLFAVTTLRQSQGTTPMEECGSPRGAEPLKSQHGPSKQTQCCAACELSR